ncbi:multicopper oxidase [Rhodococcus ruber BKS 20-38]|uniref:Multicopper oxidase n=1 Tax=Rhodococcus ruber BKS 20-38 TaxID=1278076 RepID=M2Y8M7_9NOCA|nr:multicopper oxidase family protein [Rhodococcus ruber]EME51287.1 multicopper oxidase [Rhodococcus ruber BKS 20-38]
MEPISRRRALQLGALGVTATAAGGLGLAWQSTRTPRPGTVSAAAWVEAPVLAGNGGALSLDLEAAPGRFPLAGIRVAGFGFNHGVPGPTLRVSPGDRLQVRLRNRLPQPTNLHLHGVLVSPSGNSDNPFLRVEPGTDFDYDYRLPDHHPPGVYWYPPHHHHLVADQIFAGLYGALIVEDPDPISTTVERVLVLSDLSIDDAGTIPAPTMMDRMLGREGALILANGQVRPTVTTRPGARERWRIVNACVSRHLRLRLDGQSLRLIGLDSGRFREPRPVQQIDLAAGNRADVLIDTTPGSAQLRALPVDRGTLSMMGMMRRGGADMPGPESPPQPDPNGTVLAHLEVTGPPTMSPAAIPPQTPPRDLRGEPIAATRTFVFGTGMGMGMGTHSGGMSFTIDGRTYDPDRTDHTVRLGTIEEWTLVNDSPMDHSMHLHVWPMQLTSGATIAEPHQQDVIDIPARSRLTVRVAFDDFPGRTVYHCHILDHEDNGMMGVIEAR